MSQNGIEVFIHEFLISGINCHDDSSILMLIPHEFSPLISNFENERFEFILGEFVLVFENALDDLTVESLVFVYALLYVHDDLSVGLLEGFLFGESRVGSFTIFCWGHVLVCGICQCADA